MINKIFECEFGSTVYGTSLPTSDKDYKGIYLPSAKEIILGNAVESIHHTTKPQGQLKNGSADIDTEFHTLKKYMHLLLKGETVALTMLFMPEKHILHKTSVWDIIKRNKHNFLHSGVSAFAGYCRQQANKYGIKGSRVAASRTATEFFGKYYIQNPQIKLKDIWPDIINTFAGMEHVEFLEDYMRGNPEHKVRMLSVCNRKVQEHITVKEALKIYQHLFDEYGTRALQAENNENVDWKACMHAVRVAGEAYELLTTGHITYPRPEAELLLKIRKGELPYKQVAELIENGLVSLEDAVVKSKLPKEPNKSFADHLIFNAYRDVVVDSVVYYD